jgi:murein DD-endopeptidase MepM/ murein hydrolase activator NlpD
MKRTKNRLSQPRPAARSGQTLKEFFIRYLTPISVAVAMVGLTLVILGPVRAAFANREASSEGSTAADEAEVALNVSTGTGTIILAGGNQVSRQLNPYTIVPDRARGSVISYTVQSGDTIGEIAANFGLDRNSIYWGNMDTLGSNLNHISVGMELNILPTDGVYHKSDGEHSIQWIADEYEVSPDTIIQSDYNELRDYTPEDNPPWGMMIVVPGGAGPEAEWPIPTPVETTTSSGAVAVAGFMPDMPGACGSINVTNLGSGAWIRPVAQYVITDVFSSWHSGIDLAYPVGTPIYAADSGTVIFAGWNTWGYGNLLVVDHGNGWTTYYGHLSSMYVGCGQTVQRGASIGAMGNTGRSTGPHLHFEMRWHHVPDNPASSIGF